MEVVRVDGRLKDREEDAGLVEEIIDKTRDGTRFVRVWTPHQQIAFGVRDSRRDGFEDAKKAAEKHGYPYDVRRVGGHAVAYTGSTVAFGSTHPIDDMAEGLRERYEETTEKVVDALEKLGIKAERGEPPNSFCPGDYSVQGESGKIAGIAQRVTKDTAIVSGIILVSDGDEIANVLSDVYEALGVSFDTDSVGSVEKEKWDSEVEVDRAPTSRVIEALRGELSEEGYTEKIDARDLMCR